MASFVAADDPTYAELLETAKRFTVQEFAIVAVRAPTPLLEGEGLEPIRRLVGALRATRGVERVTAATDIPFILRWWLGAEWPRQPLIERTLLSRDGRAAGILLQMRPDAPRREVVASVRRVLASFREQHPRLECILAGPYVTLLDIFDYLRRDLLYFSLSAFGLMMVMLGVLFASWRCAFFCLLGGSASMVIMMACVVALQCDVTLVAQMMVILLVVLEVANAVHLAAAHDDDHADDEADLAEATVKNGANAVSTSRGAAADDGPREAGIHDEAAASPETRIQGVVPAPEARIQQGAVALRQTLDRMGPPCFAAVLTTAVGFGSVALSRLYPLRVFGVLMSIGLFVGFAFTLLSSGLLWDGAIAPSTRMSDRFAWLARGLDRLAGMVLSRPRFVVLLFAAATLAAGTGTARLRVDSDFVQNFRVGSEVRRSYLFLTTYLSPLGPLEVVVERRDGVAILSDESVAAADGLARDMMDRFPTIAVKATSLYDVLSLWPSPMREWPLRIFTLFLTRQFMGEEVVRAFVSADGGAMRITVRMAEGMQASQKLAVAAEIGRMARQRFGEEFRVRITGLYPFYARLVQRLMRDQVLSFGATAGVIFGVFALMFKSVKVAAIATASNTVPIVACIGAMGWVGIPMNMTTLMMLSVVLGITVDSTIHFLWRCRAIMRSGLSAEVAARRTMRTTGRACLFTTVVIAGGFSLLTFSEFLPTAYFGGLLGYTMAVALASDLLLLPALMRLTRPFETA